jgi:hypothetical protein
MYIVFEVYMFKAVSRVFVIAIILVSFVGQAMTFNSSMSCETSVDDISSSFSENDKHLDARTIDINSKDNCCGIECCVVDCTCVANACSSVVYLNTEVNSTKTIALSELVYLQQPEQPRAIVTFIYRPPIFIS